MSTPKTLCLNMIVKNEMANLERCLSAVADHIACWVIGDTGSSDGTQDFIRSFFAKRGLPGELHSFPFVNFAQARNEALDRAYASSLAYDFLLLVDADMEMVVEDRDFRTRLEAPRYDLLGRTNVSNWNARIVRRNAGARYYGVTHEYLQVAGGDPRVRLHGVWFKDHASGGGADRINKFERDIRLLLEGLEQEPENRRYWFYLAQSYRGAGRTKEAAEAYAKRAAMGGWAEEAWLAQLYEAICLRTLGDEGGFLRVALAAYNQRPHRAETLYELARYCRDRGMRDASLLFSEPGLALKRPEHDELWINDFVYTAGLREEFAIAANYSRDPARRDRGHAACDWLALSREVPQGVRDLARFNLSFYSEPANALMPSFSALRVGFTPPQGWKAINPSIARRGEQILMLQRCVNFGLAVDGEYRTWDGSPLTTRNFLLRLNANLGVESSAEILPPTDLPAPAANRVLGFEDARLFAWRGELWCNSTVRQLTPEGWCEQVLARIDCPPAGQCRLTDWHVLRPEGARRHEKNWIPLVAGDDLRFIYSCDPTRVVDAQARTVSDMVPSIAAELFGGASQAIEFDGGWLALVHEVTERDSKRYYWHRFIWFDAENALRRVSRRFYFNGKGIEFAAGLAWHPDDGRLLISYGVGDSEAWIATVAAGEVRAILTDAGGLLPPGPGGNAIAANVPASGPSTPPKAAPSIPKVFHFITGLSADFGGKPFSFVHYMAVLSALRVNKGFVARLYYHYEPAGPYWDLVKQEVELVHVALPTEVFGRPVQHFAHKADVLRMQILLEHGGIYLDLDTICQRPFEPLLDGRVVMGREERNTGGGTRTIVGLCNATIIAPPGAEFLRLWYETYREFTGGDSGDAWNKFSVLIPMALSREHPDLLRVEPAASFFWPSWDKEGIESLFLRDMEFPDAFSFHLWESQSWRYLKELDSSTVTAVDTTYNRLARRFVSPVSRSELQCNNAPEDGQSPAPIIVNLINLDQDKNRLERFSTNNGHLSQVRRFSAIDGKNVDRTALEEAGHIKPDLTYNNGALGAALSHLELWRRAIAANEPIMIAEDDAIFSKDFEAASEKVLSSLPSDWDMVFWGWNFDAIVWAEIPEGTAYAKLQFDQDALRKHIGIFRDLKVPHAPLRLRHCWGHVAYSISPAGAKSIMDVCMPLRRKTIRLTCDGSLYSNTSLGAVMNEAYANVKAYICMPPLVVTENRHEESHFWPPPSVR